MNQGHALQDLFIKPLHSREENIADFLQKQTQRSRQNERNEIKMKEQDKTMARDLRQIDTSNLPDRESKELIIRLLTGLVKSGRQE